MITTVKIHERTKNQLDKLRQDNQTYDEIISSLIAQLRKKRLVQELIECYQSEEKRTIKTLEEWGAASNEVE